MEHTPDAVNSQVRPTRATLLLAMLAAATIAACHDLSNPFNSIDCTSDYRYGLSVQVRDSLTGVDVPALVVISAHDGAFADTSHDARQPQGGIAFTGWPLVGERAGTYTVRVVANGYQNWEQSGIRVSKDMSHVIPVTITARLRK